MQCLLVNVIGSPCINNVEATALANDHEPGLTDPRQGLLSESTAVLQSLAALSCLLGLTKVTSWYGKAAAGMLQVRFI